MEPAIGALRQEYIGELKNGDPHGYGSTLYSNGQMYLGEYNNGKKHGYGIVIFNNGNKFIGTFKNGQENGYAVKKEGENLLASQWIDGVMRYKSVKKIGDNGSKKAEFLEINNTDVDPKHFQPIIFWVNARSPYDQVVVWALLKGRYLSKSFYTFDNSRPTIL